MKIGPRRILPLLLTLSLATPAAGQRGRGAAPYVPPPGDAWERRAPAQVGIDSTRLAEAIAFHRAHESKAPRDLLQAHFQTFGREPFGEPVGPLQPRGDPSGIVLRHGYIVAEWGDPRRVDMTFSVTKSFLSSVIGVAYDRRMIRSLDDPVSAYMAPVFPLEPGAVGRPAAERMDHPDVLEPFATPHNRRLTWDHMLRQVSDWEGTLWGKPEWADRPSGDPATWATRPRKEPGTAYEYNDVRVNALALAALQVWRRPLPQVLREYVMEPIGASDTWRWTGYETSWVVMDGEAMQSVSGGGHWGGGMFISARDMARFGLLTLRRGRWGDRQILSEDWVRHALTPTPGQPTYGFMNWFLNTDRKQLPSAPASAFVHLGNGTNAIYVDPEHDLVVVVRWIENDQLDGFVQRVLAALTPPR
jgi:CubicO group peptidase (beta-lactamase class C family)